MRQLTLSVLVLCSIACVHTPDAKDHEIALAKYRVAIVLVHEAREAGVSGNAVHQRAKYRDALEELLEAKKIYPDDGEILYLLGFTYFTGFQRHDEAQKYLLRALSLREDDFPEADNLLGSVLVSAGRPADAIPYFDRARKNLLYKTPYFAEQELGWAKFKLGRHAEAARHLEAAVAAQPDLCGGYLKLAEVYEADDKLEAARDTLTRFVERCDSDRLRAAVGSALLAHGYFRLGMARVRAGERGLARAALQVCTTRFGDVDIAVECEKNLALLP